MDKPTTTAAIVAAVTGVFSAGAFKFYEFILKQKREKIIQRDLKLVNEIYGL